MGVLTTFELDALIVNGCNACASKQLVFSTYVDGLFTVMGGEPIARPTWIYDGDTFLDGVYQVDCAGCRQTVFSVDVCPRCHAREGLAKALASENAYPVPARCPSCGNEEARFCAMVPAKVVYASQRAEKAKSSHELHDPGVHGFRVDCKDCGTVAELVDRCPLCDRAGPIRKRPG